MKMSKVESAKAAAIAVRRLKELESFGKAKEVHEIRATLTVMSEDAKIKVLAALAVKRNWYTPEAERVARRAAIRMARLRDEEAQRQHHFQNIQILEQQRLLQQQQVQQHVHLHHH